LAGSPRSLQEEVFTPIVDKTVGVMGKLYGAENVKAIGARIEKNRSVSCLFTEYEYITPGGVKLSQAWVCPMGNKNIKLSTSYRKSESIVFKPIIDYIFESLSVTSFP
jgi:hypothetical protein